MIFFLLLMKNSYSISVEIIISLILLVLLGLVFHPQSWMPPMAVTFLALGLAVVFTVFAIFFWREQAQDEREGLHRLMAGRVAFLTGAAVLVLGIVSQTVQHQLDPWLIATLGAMVLAKMGCRIYSQLKN